MATATLTGVVAYVRRLSDRDTHCLSDQQLLNRFASEQSEFAFAELVRRHGPMVLAACRRVLRHEQDAEDAFQAAFLVLARKASSIRERDCLAGWLYQVAHRLALRAKSDGARYRVQLETLDRAKPTNSANDLLRAALDEELERLPEPYRAPLVLCYLEGRTQNEAARMLVTTADAINSRLKRAREMLRQRLGGRGWVLSTAALAAALAANATQAAMSPVLVQLTAKTAIQFAFHPTLTSGVSALTAGLAKGAMHTMFPSKFKMLFGLFLCLAFIGVGALFAPSFAGHKRCPHAPRDVDDREASAKEKKPDEKKTKAPVSVILLWMSGGPSQLDTFDPKKGKIALFKPIDTSVKDLQFCETLPKLAKQAQHLAVVRSMTHRTGDHQLGAHLMRTGYDQKAGVTFPGLGCVLAKELGADRPDLPRYFLIGSTPFESAGFGPSFLGEKYAGIPVGPRLQIGDQPFEDASLPLPAAEAFESDGKGKGEVKRKAVAEAFDLTKEKAAVRDAYGRTHFGQSCLLARRLVERGVPVVEIVMGGWDMHGKAKDAMESRARDLDAGMATLVKDLEERKKLDSTLIVWMGEFGRTPRVNANGGRDHHMMAFTAVLAGRGIKGGQAIGKTSADGAKVEERPVTPQEFLATIYQAVGVDATKTNRTAGGQIVPLVEKGTESVKEALR